jgi:hypothetical protein
MKIFVSGAARTLALVLLLIQFNFSCVYDKADNCPGGCCDELNPSYRFDIVPIMTTYCTNPSFGHCHQQGAQTDFTRYDILKLKADGGHIGEHVIQKREMPPPYSTGPKKIVDTDLKALRCWLEKGALNN